MPDYLNDWIFGRASHGDLMMTVIILWGIISYHTKMIITAISSHHKN